MLNIYTPPHAAASTAPRFDQSDIFPPGPAATLVAGHFNIHYYSADPSRSISRKEYLAPYPFFSMADQRDYTLLNTPAIYTKFPLSGIGRQAVLDLAFASGFLSLFLSGWDTPYESTRSDHVPILMTFATPSLIAPRPSPDGSRIN